MRKQELEKYERKACIFGAQLVLFFEDANEPGKEQIALGFLEHPIYWQKSFRFYKRSYPSAKLTERAWYGPLGWETERTLSIGIVTKCIDIRIPLEEAVQLLIEYGITIKRAIAVADDYDVEIPAVRVEDVPDNYSELITADGYDRSSKRGRIMWDIWPEPEIERIMGPSIH